LHGVALSFSPAAFSFLRGLKRNNNKPWFEANRPVYERSVRAPMHQLIEEIDIRFRRFAPEMTGDPKRSMFRINRDTRFSRDKSPYKYHVACWFRHRGADHRVGSEAEGGSAGFYFHLEPGNCLIGAGIWMPPRPMLNRLRDAIAEDYRGFVRVVEAPALKRRFGGLEDEAMLKRMPRGFSEDHPAAKWLRYQSFTIGQDLPDRQVTSSGLGTLLEKEFRAMLPLVRWLNHAIGL
jgi:uncharacterized protein (TIGR02453 family)